MVIERGEVWWANLPDPAGSAPGYRRPVLIVQSNTFNRSRIATVTVAALTSNIRSLEAPGNVLVPAKATRLARDSVVNVAPIITVNRDALDECVSAVAPAVMRQVDEGIRLALDL